VTPVEVNVPPLTITPPFRLSVPDVPWNTAPFSTVTFELSDTAPLLMVIVPDSAPPPVAAFTINVLEMVEVSASVPATVIVPVSKPVPPLYCALGPAVKALGRDSV
jgi:hypothetical protein